MTNEEIRVKNMRISERLVYEQKKIILDREKKHLTGYATVDKPWEKYYPEEVLKSSLPEMTIFDYLLKNNEYNLDRTALNYFERKIPYGELISNINKTAKALVESGVKKGDIVSIALPTVPETIYLFYALSKIGAISNMIDPRTSKEGIENYVKECNSKILFIVDQALSKAHDMKEKCGVDEVISISPADSLPKALNYGYRAKSYIESLKHSKEDKEFAKECTKWNEFFERGKKNKNYTYPEYEKNRPVVIVHTGGTTGTSKGVLLSNDNLNAASFQCEIAGFDFQKNQSWLNIMPPFIAYGVGNGLHLPLACGMETILIPAFDANKFANLLNKHKPNHMVGVPSHYGNIIKSDILKDKDLSYIIAPTVGGDAMNTALEKDTNEFLFRRGCPYLVTKGYGMTEVSAAVVVCNNNLTNEIGSVGIPFSHTTVAIFDPVTNKELKYNEEGEVCITGPNTMVGYLNNKEEQDKILKVHEDGKTWVHSGDLGKMDEDGKLYIIGRIKRMIIRHDGFKVHPSKIEEVISKHKDVLNVCVVGIKDNNYIQGRLPKAYIILNTSEENKQKVINEIKALCDKELPEYAIPVDYEVVDKFPLTPIGKVDYLKLESLDENKEQKEEEKKVRIRK